jgi:hypothetical protein
MHLGETANVQNRIGGRTVRRLMALVAGVASLVVPLGLAGQASAATPAPTTCSGTSTTPGSLAGGTYSTVTVSGVCGVNAGQVTVTGDVNVSSGGALIAAYANNSSGPGTSGITVDGNMNVASGATLLLGCEASEFACVDDPNQSAPTLNSADTVQGSIVSTAALGVVVHNTTVGADVIQTGGGGGPSCTPSGIFSLFMSPVYSTYEDMTVSGNLRVTGLTSCWFGAIRDKIGGSLTYAGNNLTDPDASENLTNQIGGNLLCTNDVPAVQYGDSGASPNVVGGFATGQCAFGVKQPSPAPSGTLMPISTPATAPQGYWLTAGDGGVFSYGATFFGSATGQTLAQPIAGMAAVPGGGSYNLAEGTGTVFGEGPHASDCSGLTATLNKPVVGVAPASGGNGCWLAASDGGVFALGSNAPFFGSAGSLKLVQPVVGISSTPNNDGYDLVASDGGVFTYGPGAGFFGSMGGKPLNQPVVGIAIDPVTGGYWLVAKDGGVFAFNAPYLGSMGGKPLNAPIVGIAAAPTGDGYYLVASDGGVFAFGTGAHFQGSAGSLHLVKPIVGMALG